MDDRSYLYLLEQVTGQMWKDAPTIAIEISDGHLVFMDIFLLDTERRKVLSRIENWRGIVLLRFLDDLNVMNGFGRLQFDCAAVEIERGIIISLVGSWSGSKCNKPSMYSLGVTSLSNRKSWSRQTWMITYFINLLLRIKTRIATTCEEFLLPCWYFSNFTPIVALIGFSMQHKTHKTTQLIPIM